jgi:hypothetical protein
MPENIINELEALLAKSPSEAEVLAWIKTLPIPQQFECRMYLFRKSPKGFVRVLDPALAYKGAGSLSKEQLFQEMAKALDDGTYVDEEGRISPLNPRTNPEPMSRYASLHNEAVVRGYKYEEIRQGVRSFLKVNPTSLSIEDPSWKRFEKLVARIHMALCEDAEVKWNEKVKDVSGTERQIDVTIRSKLGPYKTLGIVQCKHQGRPVSMDDVGSFLMVKHDLNANLAILVSRSGFQEGAKVTARQHGIRLCTLSEAEELSWRDEARQFTILVHWFDRIAFHPDIPPGAIAEGIDDLATITIHRETEERSLTNVLAAAAQDATQRCLRLPCWFDMNVPAGSWIRLRGREFPLEYVSLHFDHKIEIEQTTKISVPTGARYLLQQSDGNEISITESELPPLHGD